VQNALEEAQRAYQETRAEAAELRAKLQTEQDSLSNKSRERDVWPYHGVHVLRNEQRELDAAKVETERVKGLLSIMQAQRGQHQEDIAALEAKLEALQNVRDVSV